MSLSKVWVKNGQFVRDGRRFVPFGPVYFARKPGTCGGPFFDDEWWPEARSFVERDFARMAEIGCNLVVPFVKTTRFYAKGQPVEKMFERFDDLLRIADKNGLYVFPLPNCPIDVAYENLMGKPYEPDPQYPHKHMSVNPHIFDMKLKEMLIWGKRYGQVPALLGILGGAGGGRLWTGYAGYAPGEPEGRELLPVKKTWQQWLKLHYRDDFAAFLKSHPQLPENPKSWDDVALPVEVEGQFTEDDSRTYDFLAFTAHASATAQTKLCEIVQRETPGLLLSGGAEGCEFERGPMEALIPGINNVPILWLEAYQFNMTHSTHTHPDWERRHFFEPTTGKLAIDMLNPITEAWERTRYLKAASPNSALMLCHGTVLESLIRWTPEPRDQRIIFERLHRCYLDAGADGIGFWCWTDDETSARPEPEYFFREGESMGFIDLAGAWRPVARRAAVYAKAMTNPPRVSQDVLQLLVTPQMMGLDRIDGLTTAACLTSALARLGVAPEVKYTYWKGNEGIPVEELLPFKMVVLSADEYRKDFTCMPGVLCKYVEAGGRLVLAMGTVDTLLSPTHEPLPNADLARLLGSPKIGATNHQHHTFWSASVRWRLRDDFLPYWDRRRGRWMPGRGEKRMTFKWVQPPSEARVLAEAVVPMPPADPNAFYGWSNFQLVGENAWHPFLYRHTLGKGAVYVITYSMNIFRSHLDEIDVQRDDWDWILQAAIDDAGVATDPCHSLSVLAQEFMNFRPTR